jgi:hypothetical protein
MDEQLKQYLEAMEARILAAGARAERRIISALHSRAGGQHLDPMSRKLEGGNEEDPGSTRIEGRPVVSSGQ